MGITCQNLVINTKKKSQGFKMFLQILENLSKENPGIDKLFVSIAQLFIIILKHKTFIFILCYTKKTPENGELSSTFPRIILMNKNVILCM